MNTKLKNVTLLLSTLCICAGCEISPPPNVGSYCPGIIQENILHTSSDECMMSDNCPEQDAIAIEMGYCPPGFTCVENHGVVQCKHGCESDKVMCGGECIDPLVSMTHCGAKLGGTCSDSLSHSSNYQGEDCTSVQSSSRMVCTNGKCQPNECDPEFHPVLHEDGTTSCERDTKDACGSVDVKCKNTEVCKAGFCSESCPQSQIACEGTCIDPLTSTAFCGAKEGCVDFDPCEGGSVCSDGQCRILDCPDENQMKCMVDGLEKCIDVASDQLNCGSCDNNCDTYKPANATTIGCAQKTCLYQCEEGFDNCGIDGVMECVDLTGTKAHCGECENACVGKQFCKHSSCAENDCQEFECPQADQCKRNDPEACGEECVNCKTRFHAETATCDDVGECHVTVCSPGFHLAGTENNYTCEPNTDNSCGSTDTVNAIDCTAISNVKLASCITETGECNVISCNGDYHVLNSTSCEMNDDNNCGLHENKCQVNNGTSQCQNGVCKTTACNTGFHETSNICVSDDLSDCGGIDCATITGWANGTCDNGICKVLECRSGFHLAGSAGNYSCASNSKTSCGSTNKVNATDCTAISNADSVSCEGGICKVSSCKGNYHVLDNSSCEKNDNNNCGYHGHVCSITNGTSECQSGSCKTTSCATGFHVESNICVEDSVSNCGGKNCSNTVSHWLSGSCDNGTCKVSACDSGFHVYSNACEENSVTNCKAHDNKCSSKDSNGSTFTCDPTNGCQATACKSGYHVYNNGCHNGTGSDHKCCEAHSNSNCGSHGTACTKDHASSVSCSSGTCQATACNSGYYLDSTNHTCVPENAENCGSEGYNCANHVTGWAGGTCENGSCKVSSCTSNYHVYNNACELNSNTACGKNRSKCTNTSYQIYNCTGSGENATCTITGCTGNYHFYSGTCEANTLDNCGEHNRKCSTYIQGWGSGSCTNGECVLSSCTTGYIPHDGICFRSCASQIYLYGTSYCCPDSFYAQQCTDYSNCSNCSRVDFYTGSNPSSYDYDKYYACVPSSAGFTQYSNIFCSGSICSMMQYLSGDYLKDQMSFCYYRGY